MTPLSWRSDTVICIRPAIGSMSASRPTDFRSLSLTATPARYYRYMTQRYDSEQNIDIFRQQQMFSASAGLEVTQNFDLLGGSLYLETDLEYMRNFGQNKYTQYSSVPVRIGYRQDLIGFNAFKWGAQNRTSAL